MTKREITYRSFRNLTKTSNKTHRCLNFEVFGDVDSNRQMTKFLCRYNNYIYMYFLKINQRLHVPPKCKLLWTLASSASAKTPKNANGATKNHCFIKQHFHTLKSDYQISYCMIDRAIKDLWIAFVWKFIFKYEFYPPIQSSPRQYHIKRSRLAKTPLTWCMTKDRNGRISDKTILILWLHAPKEAKKKKK